MNWSAHELTMTVLMTPDMANFSGNVHGGTILKYLDSVAYACASRYSGSYVVTLSVDQVMFLQPWPHSHSCIDFHPNQCLKHWPPVPLLSPWSRDRHTIPRRQRKQGYSDPKCHQPLLAVHLLWR